MKLLTVMKRTTWVLTFALTGAASAETTGPVARWAFDQEVIPASLEPGKACPKLNAVDSVSRTQDAVLGYGTFGPGVSGGGFKGDGFTSRIVRRADAAPALTNAFSIEAWIAPQEYPWNWAGLVDQEQVAKAWIGAAPVRQDQGLPGEAQGGKAGYSLGINKLGQVGLYAAIGGHWQGCLSRNPVPLLQWSHVVGVFDPGSGFEIYVDGQRVGENRIQGAVTPASETDLWVGMSHRKQVPAGTERGPSARFYSAMVFDGLLDEVRLHGRSLTAEAIRRAFAEVKVADPRPLQYRKIPTGPEGSGRFGAYYARLKYCPEWDRLWRVADHPDVVVQFDESPTKLIFWRGTGYIPYWAAENGVCVADEGAESGNAWGCCEAMSDKQCRYSHVRIIESTPARAVIHWRTASPDIRYESNQVNPDTGWGEWTDEYYYTYPDGVSVRYQLVHSDGVSGWMEFQQTQTLNQPGTRPQDNLETEAITVMNMNGETGSYIWDKPYGRWGKPLDNATIQVTNLKARNRHYVIGETGSKWIPFSFGAPPWTYFPCWNHWPVAQVPNDGRVAAAPDRPSSSCCGTLVPVKHKIDAVTMSACNLYGMTDQPVRTLVTLARSWNFPAEMKVATEGVGSLGYDKNQRAYVLDVNGGQPPSKLELKLMGSSQSPVLNPAFVIRNWGESGVNVMLDGKGMPRGRTFRCGYVNTLGGCDLIIWLKHESEQPVAITLEKR
jgi:hypothetical protein